MAVVTRAQVLGRVAAVRRLTADPEAAHAAEDTLHRDVLTAIATGQCDEPDVIAGLALRTADIEFGRWYG